MTIREKCFTKATLAKIGHLDTVKEIFATLSETYVRTDRYLEEILVPIPKMRPIDENEHVGLKTFYVYILALCVESWALNMFHHVANLLVTAMFVDRFTLSKIRDWDSYCNGEGVNYPNEFRAMEQFCRDRLPGVHRLADRQKTRAAVKLQQQHKQNPNPNHGQRDFHRDKGHGRNFEHDRKRELYWVSSAATNVAHASQQVSPPKNEAFATKLNPEARPFNSNAPAKCDFPNCNNQSGPHFLGKFPVFKSKSAFDRQKWVTAKNLCAICFKKAHTHVSQCRLLEVMKKLDRRPAHEDQESDEDNSEDQVEAVREAELASEDEKKLEPEKEKYPQNQDEEARLEYCSMEAIADRWRDKPKRQEAASACSEVGEKADVKPLSPE